MRCSFVLMKGRAGRCSHLVSAESREALEVKGRGRVCGLQSMEFRDMWGRGLAPTRDCSRSTTKAWG